MKNKVEALTKQLFEKLDIKTDLIEIISTEKENTFNIKIKSEESGIIIGNHGRTFDAIQNILKLMCSQNIGDKVKINLEVNDYKKTKDERLIDFIKKEIEYLKKIGKDIQLPYYSAHERKKIHSFIHKLDDDSISSKSIGDGKERRMYLSIKDVANKLTIDIDGDDI